MQAQETRGFGKYEQGQICTDLVHLIGTQAIEYSLRCRVGPLWAGLKLS